MSGSRPSSNRVQLIQPGICFPFIQKDSLGQIGKQQLSFGADQLNSEAITWHRSLSAPEIIFRLNLEFGSEVGRWSFTRSDLLASTCSDRSMFTCVTCSANEFTGCFPLTILPFVLLQAIFSTQRQAQHFCTTCCSPKSHQRGRKGRCVFWSGRRHYCLVQIPQNKLFQSGQEENRSRVQATLTAQSSRNKLQEQLQRCQTQIISAI